MRQKHKQIHKKKIVLLAVGSVLAVSAIALVTINQVAISQDHARFQQAEQEKDAIASKLVTALGDNVVSTRMQNECFNTEQGPYDHGNLWCQVATVIRLKREVDYQKLGDTYLSIGKLMSKQTAYDKGVFPRYTVEAASMDCELEYQDAQGDHRGNSMGIPFVSSDHVAVAITCADRAKATYYPYTG